MTTVTAVPSKYHVMSPAKSPTIVVAMMTGA